MRKLDRVNEHQELLEDICTGRTERAPFDDQVGKEGPTILRIEVEPIPAPVEFYEARESNRGSSFSADAVVPVRDWHPAPVC